MNAVQKRRYGLLAALLLTLFATWWVAGEEEEEASALAQPMAGQRRAAPAAVSTAATAKAQAATTKQTATTALDWTPVARQPWAETKDAQFAAWAPPPPPPPPQVAKGSAVAAPPMAPAFPYQLIGRLVDGGQAQGFLSGPNRSLAVKAGDVVDGQWRIDQVTEQGVKLTWLPAQLTQTIAFRPAS